LNDGDGGASAVSILDGLIDEIVEALQDFVGIDRFLLSFFLNFLLGWRENGEQKKASCHCGKKSARGHE